MIEFHGLIQGDPLSSSLFILSIEISIKYLGFLIITCRKGIEKFSDMVNMAITIKHVLLALPIHILVVVTLPNFTLDLIENFIVEYF
ncbi:hypothetical protein H5410_040807, partial [Solanum commersonii]